jgi:hypothetical protein
MNSAFNSMIANPVYGQGWTFFLTRALVLLIAVVLVYLAVLAIRNSRSLATPDNIKRIQTQQQALLEPVWTGITAGKKGLQDVARDVKLPNDQNLLINTAVFSTRLTGYLGPYTSGVYDEDVATRLALSSGSRCLILEIDREVGSNEPKLIYRDAWGIKQSLNTGSIEKIAKSIAGRAFSASSDSVPAAVANDPLFVVLYFVSAPNPAKEPRDYIRFLGKVAQQLQPLKDRLVGQTPQGDFRRQALESQLFFQPTSVFKGRILMLCNADTTGFRRLSALGLAGEIGSNQDLDLFVHARLYAQESPSDLGISTQPSSTSAPAAIITTPGYWFYMPPDRLSQAQTQTKKTWTLVMPPVASEKVLYTKDNLTQLYTQFGVHAIPFTLFDQKNVTDLFVGKGAVFNTRSWSVKPDLLRFIPPKPIVGLKPSPQTNAAGGFLSSPKL